MNERVILRSDDAISEAGAMRFRLVYEGQFFASSGEPKGDQVDRRAIHKHNMRRSFHRQLKHLWQTHPAVAETVDNGSVFGQDFGERLPLHEVCARSHEINGFRWAPLVCREFSLLCGLEILMLRRDRPGAIFKNTRDIDNRLKTLFDALRMPVSKGELGNHQPQGGEDPFFVLLQDDALINHVSVETDDLLDAPIEAAKDDSWARLLVTVTINPYKVTLFNLSFASPG